MPRVLCKNPTTQKHQVTDDRQPWLQTDAGGKMWRSISSLIQGVWIQDKVEKDPSYDLAVKFSDTYQPSSTKDYKWVLDYSIKEYEMASLRVESLDGKADTLIGYLGAGSGLISFGLAYGLGEHNVHVLIAAIPALFLILAAVLLALVARIPARFPALPYAEAALRQVESEDGQRAIGKFAANVWVSTKSIALSAREKARFVRWAYWCFGLGITWIVLFSVYSSLTH
jgi:hypothetical protein